MSTSIKHGVVNMEAGLVAEFEHCVFNFYLATRSTEVAAQESDLVEHRWGGINLSFKL